MNVLLADFETMEAAGEAVYVTAEGLLPAGMEIMDNVTINAVDDFFGYDEYPRDAAAVLLIELDGQVAEVQALRSGLSSCVVMPVPAACALLRTPRSARFSGRDASQPFQPLARSLPLTTSRTAWFPEAAFHLFWLPSNG